MKFSFEPSCVSSEFYAEGLDQKYLYLTSNITNDRATANAYFTYLAQNPIKNISLTTANFKNPTLSFYVSNW